jgi:hypothetical protein
LTDARLFGKFESEKIRRENRKRKEIDQKVYTFCGHASFMRLKNAYMLCDTLWEEPLFDFGGLPRLMKLKKAVQDSCTAYVQTLSGPGFI